MTMKNEEEIGKAIRESDVTRNEIILITKIWITKADTKEQKYPWMNQCRSWEQSI